MSDLRDFIVRWQYGWTASRALPEAEDVGGGLRSHCRQMGRDIEYVALDDNAATLTRLAERVAGEDDITWLTVPTTDLAAVGDTLTAAGLIVLKQSELMMTIDLRDHPQDEPAQAYQVETEVDGRAINAVARHESGEIGASGLVGLTGTYAVADRISTAPAHRRKGLASAVMGALARTAIKEGAETGILIASEEGQFLYARLGWQPVAGVLIASTPGVTYPA